MENLKNLSTGLAAHWVKFINALILKTLNCASFNLRLGVLLSSVSIIVNICIPQVFHAQYVEEQLILATDGQHGSDGSQFGVSVAAENNTLLVGAWRHDVASTLEGGAAYIFHYDGSLWNEVQQLVSSDNGPYDLFGFSCDLSGNFLIIGSHGDDNTSPGTGASNGPNIGSAFIFEFDGASWIESQKLMASDADEDDNYGYSVAISGNMAVVGSRFSNNIGAAYVYDYNGIQWNEMTKLVASDVAVSDEFGIPVAMEGNVIIVGAYRDDDNGTNSGSAYIFEFDGANWNETQKLTASDGAIEDGFGGHLSISGNVFAVSAYQDDDNGVNSGSVYVFSNNGSTWMQTQKLIASDGVSEDRFGNVFILNNTIAIGAPGSTTDPRAAYIFEFDGASWNETQKLTASIGNPLYDFGRDITMTGNNILVGSPGYSGKTGAVYSYFPDCIENLEICDGLDNDCDGSTDEDFPDTDGDDMSDCIDPDDDNDGCPDTEDANLLIVSGDQDMDGVPDDCDSCPNDSDNDIDDDGVCGDLDNCPNTANADQSDADDDGIGNVCDNCVEVANTDQTDVDDDGIGDDCDACPEEVDHGDHDGDGYPDCVNCGNNKILICHVPPGNSCNEQLLCVNQAAAEAHLAWDNGHGTCYLGACLLLYCNDLLVSTSVEPQIATQSWRQQQSKATEQYSRIGNPGSKLEINVYPNPVNDKFNISIHDADLYVDITIYDHIGKIVWTKQLGSDGISKVVSLDSSQLSSGIFTLRATSAGRQYVKKFIVVD